MGGRGGTGLPMRTKGETIMKKRFLRTIALAMLLALVVGATGALAENFGYLSPDSDIAGLDLKENSKATMVAGQKMEFGVVAKAGRIISCTSSDKKVATVSSKGVVTARKAGKAKITFNTKKGLKKYVLTLTVMNKPKIANSLLYIEDRYVRLELVNVPDNYEVIRVTSGKPSVIMAESEGSQWVQPKKAGKSKITVELMIDGNPLTLFRTIAVENAPNAVKSLTFNGKKVDLTKEYHKTHYEHLDFDLTKATVNLKPASGWKISKIKGHYTDADTDKYIKSFAVSNNTQFKVPTKYNGFVTYTLKNTKTGKTFDYVVQVLRIGE